MQVGKRVSMGMSFKEKSNSPARRGEIMKRRES